MSWKSTAIIVTFLINVVPVSLYADQQDTSSLLKLYAASNAADRIHIETLMVGAQRGMLVASQWIAQGRKQVPLYCEPKNLSLTGPQLISILRGAAAEDPVLARSDWGFSLLFALMRAFPCAKNSN